MQDRVYGNPAKNPSGNGSGKEGGRRFRLKRQYSQLPNQITDAWGRHLTESLSASHAWVTVVISRLTLGYGDKDKEVSLASVARLSGLSQNRSREILADLEATGVLVRSSHTGRPSTIGLDLGWQPTPEALERGVTRRGERNTRKAPRSEPSHPGRVPGRGETNAGAYRPLHPGGPPDDPDPSTVAEGSPLHSGGPPGPYTPVDPMINRVSYTTERVDPESASPGSAESAPREKQAACAEGGEHPSTEQLAPGREVVKNKKEHSAIHPSFPRDHVAREAQNGEAQSVPVAATEPEAEPPDGMDGSKNGDGSSGTDVPTPAPLRRDDSEAQSGELVRRKEAGKSADADGNRDLKARIIREVSELPSGEVTAEANRIGTLVAEAVGREGAPGGFVSRLAELCIRRDAVELLGEVASRTAGTEVKHPQRYLTACLAAAIKDEEGLIEARPSRPGSSLERFEAAYTAEAAGTPRRASAAAPGQDNRDAQGRRSLTGSSSTPAYGVRNPEIERKPEDYFRRGGVRSGGVRSGSNGSPAPSTDTRPQESGGNFSVDKLRRAALPEANAGSAPSL